MKKHIAQFLVLAVALILLGCAQATPGTPTEQEPVAAVTEATTVSCGAVPDNGGGGAKRIPAAEGTHSGARAAAGEKFRVRLSGGKQRYVHPPQNRQ